MMVGDFEITSPTINKDTYSKKEQVQHHTMLCEIVLHVPTPIICHNRPPERTFNQYLTVCWLLAEGLFHEYLKTLGADDRVEFLCKEAQCVDHRAVSLLDT